MSLVDKFTSLDPWRSLLLPLTVLIILALAWWGFGHHYRVVGRAEVQAKWDAQKVKDAAAVASALEQQSKDKEAYDTQLKDAALRRAAAEAELARLRAQPHPRVVCRDAAPHGGGAVPAVPGPGGAPVAGAGQFPPLAEFDPTDALYAEADRADDTVEACRDFANRVPTRTH